MNEKLENNSKNFEEKIKNLKSDFDNYKSQNDNNINKNLTNNLNTYKTQNEQNVTNLTNNLNTYKTQNDQKVSNLSNDLNSFKTQINQKINEINNILTNKIKKEILDMSYPVGTYYWSQRDKNPGELFGGKWEKIQGKFLFAENNNHKAGTEGGEEVHKLTINEIPTHNHGFPKNLCSYKNIPDIQIGGGGGTKKLYENDGAIGNTKDIGGGQPHNNMPPFIAAYCWRRKE